jgi:hypothetical protein
MWSEVEGPRSCGHTLGEGRLGCRAEQWAYSVTQGSRAAPRHDRKTPETSVPPERLNKERLVVQLA